jgi:hypothetical protein
MQITREDLDHLIKRDGRPEGRILSVYLDIDQSKAANLNRGFAAALKDMLRSLQQPLGDQLRQDFAADAERVVDFVLGHSPGGRSLVLFCDASRDFFWHRELNIPVRNEAHWEEGPYVKPLLDLLDEFERYCVALVSKEEARLFTVQLGEIEERREVMGEKIKRSKQTAKDNRPSSLNLQRKEDEHALRNLKDVASALERLTTQCPCRHLVLAGPAEVTRELFKLLPKRLQTLVIGSSALPIGATEQEIRQETLHIREQVERERETRIVEELITAASKGNQAVIELQPVLDALRQGRIRTLVYGDGPAMPGAQCGKCNSVFAGGVDSCPYCGAGTRAIQDLVGRVAELTVDAGGRAENVRGEAAARLHEAGGIGAFLRF